MPKNLNVARKIKVFAYLGVDTCIHACYNGTVTFVTNS